VIAPANSRILVVDDDEVGVTAVSHLLRKHGYDVIQARSGGECLTQVARHHPDLILLDVKLPDLNGVEVLKRLRSEPHYNDIFVVHLSAQAGSAETKMLGLELGADGYISQPVDNHELVTRVRAFLRHKATLDALRESERRYRDLFESNPEPMWIYEKQSGRIVAVNNAAVHQYGFSREEFLAMHATDLVIEPQRAAAQESQSSSSHYGSYTHRTKIGLTRDVETNEQEIIWRGCACRVVLAHDVSERNRIDQEKTRQLERLEREYRSLRKLGGDRHEDSPRNIPEADLHTRNAAARGGLALQYEQILRDALDNRIYKTGNDPSSALRSMACELLQLQSTARDVIAIHCETMRKLAPLPESPRAQAFIEVGRISLIELLGHLLSGYRQLCSREEINGK
jgi:PAS domain S-box-containing protein